MTKDELIRRLRECEGRGRNENFQKIEPAPAPALPGGRGRNEYFQEIDPAPSPVPAGPYAKKDLYDLPPNIAREIERRRGKISQFSDDNFGGGGPMPSPSGPSINSGPYRGRKPLPGDATPRGEGAYEYPFDRYPERKTPRQRPSPGGYGLQTMEFRDRNRNGIDDRDEEDRRRELDEIYNYIEERRKYGYPRNSNY